MEKQADPEELEAAKAATAAKAAKAEAAKAAAEAAAGGEGLPPADPEKLAAKAAEMGLDG